jgi:hypothetical protein
MINRRMLVITETKTDISIPHFQEKYENDNRQGTVGEDYSSESVLMYGLDTGFIETTDWWMQEFEETPHRDCSSEDNCTKGVMFSHGFAQVEMAVMHKCSESHEVSVVGGNALYDERMAYNAENDISYAVNLYPCDEHWNIDWENPIVG